MRTFVILAVGWIVYTAATTDLPDKVRSLVKVEMDQGDWLCHYHDGETKIIEVFTYKCPSELYE